MAEQKLPKLTTRVRFPSPAPTCRAPPGATGHSGRDRHPPQEQADRADVGFAVLAGNAGPGDAKLDEQLIALADFFADRDFLRPFGIGLAGEAPFGHGDAVHDQVDLLGFSLGGGVAQAILIDHPELVRRAILAGTGYVGGGGLNEVTKVAVLAYLKAALTLRDPKHFLFFPRTPQGKRAATDYMAAKIKQAIKVVVADAGHAANLHQPALFNQAVEAFLARLPAA